MISERTSLRERLVAPLGGSKDWVDVAKGVAIIMVIFYHCSLFLSSANITVPGAFRLKAALELVPMPVFLAIAGIFHARVLQWSLKDTWRRRLLGYAYLYLLWCVLRFAFYLVVPNVRSDGAGAQASRPIFLALSPVWPTSSYWFIWALFLLTLVLWLVRRGRPWLVVTIAALVSVASSSNLVVTGNVGWDRTAEYAVFFLAGAFYSKRLTQAVTAARPVVPLVSVALLLLVAGAGAFVPGARGVPGLALVGQVAAIVATATASKYVVRLRPLSWLSYLGARSLPLYLIHVFVIAIIALGVSVAGLDRLSSATTPFLLLAMVVIVVVASVLLGRVLARVRWLFTPPRFVNQLVAGAPRAAVRTRG
ncbi:Uncharacterized membrane protein YcfT [Quadrisphaera granulorum]|uniref:Putative membrane protein YcfT n=1 Tax=Quadrisphaera granulorum TaxID=317664 RepID=A0A315ZUL8_9ACTN|nr:acyltransferase [Quadrisphaera granulorum]PWJ48640.1 putative membrane protein YcfT [Quadrisphaera granulorum]SZE98362.1 Uncharacterized membrane protein YcfT [Quadrisphaera granulorum]